MWTTVLAKLISGHADTRGILIPQQERPEEPPAYPPPDYRGRSQDRDKDPFDVSEPDEYVRFCIPETNVREEDMTGIHRRHSLCIDTSIVVDIQFGRTNLINITGRGTVQGDALNPVLFTLVIKPQKRWLSANDRSHEFRASSQRGGLITFADDVAVLTSMHKHATAQTRRMVTFLI